MSNNNPSFEQNINDPRPPFWFRCIPNTLITRIFAFFEIPNNVNIKSFENLILPGESPPDRDTIQLTSMSFLDWLDVWDVWESESFVRVAYSQKDNTLYIFLWQGKAVMTFGHCPICRFKNNYCICNDFPDTKGKQS